MPESIRTLLHDIGDDDPGPSRDIAAGAIGKARAIGRRRFAAGAVGAATALALAGAGTAGLINDRNSETLPAGDDPTTVEEPTDPATETEALAECGVRPQDWADAGYSFPALGGSSTVRELDAIPENPLYRLIDPESEGKTSWRILADGEATGLDTEGGFEYHVAPDANRVIAVDRANGCGAVYMEIGFDSAIEDVPFLSVETVHCPISWSPDSDKVLFTEPVGFEDSKSYMLNVSTGELTELPEELYCGGVWLPDSEHVWISDTVMRPDGSDAVQLPGLADGEVGGDDMWWPTGISADRGEICAQDYLEEQGDIIPWKCDYYIDAETGEPLELPVVGDGDRQVVFLDDGSMLILADEGGTATQYLVDGEGTVIDERVLPAEYAEVVQSLASYYPW